MESNSKLQLWTGRNKFTSVAEAKLCADMGVSYYPQIKFLRRNQYLDVTGSRENEDLVKYMESSNNLG